MKKESKEQKNHPNPNKGGGNKPNQTNQKSPIISKVIKKFRLKVYQTREKTVQAES